jgi:hypothetical protein
MASWRSRSRRKKILNNMKKMVSENVKDFLNFNDEPMKISDMENIENEEVVYPEDEEGEEYIEVENTMDQMRKIFKNEIESPEYSRSSFILIFKDGKILKGTPMAELSYDAFLFKVEGQLKKIKIPDLLKFSYVQESKEEVNESFDGEYPFSDYMLEIANYIKTELPNWDLLVGEEDTERDVIDWLEENQDLWDLQDLYAAGYPAEDAAQKIMVEFQIESEEEEE